MVRTALFLMLAWGLASSSAFAQVELPQPNTTLLDIQPGEREAEMPARLRIYKPKYITADEAQLLLRNVFGEEVTIVAMPPHNQLVIRGPEAQLKDVQALLQELDQPPQTIAVEVLFADLPAKAEEAESRADSTSEADWLKRVKQHEDKTKGGLNTVRLTAVENQKSMVQFGEQTPVVTGVQQGFGGRGAPQRTPTLRQTSTGTIVQCTARVLDDGTILAEFEIERSRLSPPEDSAILDESDDAGTLRAPGQLTTTCKTTLKLKPGQPSVVSGLRSQGANRGTQSVIIITVELIKAE